MITFKINGNKFQIPTQWDDVTYSQYITLATLPETLIHQISLFTGIPIETLEKAELKNLEKIALALSFLSLSPKMESKPTKMVGPFAMPSDVTLQSTGQFENLRALISKIPKDLSTAENLLILGDLSLEACAIYVQKLRDVKFDSDKVPEVKEQLKNYSCIEVLQTGGFFLFKLLNLSHGIMTRSQSIRQRLKRLIVDFPGFQKTLDSLQPSLRKPKE